MGQNYELQAYSNLGYTQNYPYKLNETVQQQLNDQNNLKTSMALHDVNIPNQQFQGQAQPQYLPDHPNPYMPPQYPGQPGHPGNPGNPGQPGMKNQIPYMMQNMGHPHHQNVMNPFLPHPGQVQHPPAQQAQSQKSSSQEGHGEGESREENKGTVQYPTQGGIQNTQQNENAQVGVILKLWL